MVRSVKIFPVVLMTLFCLMAGISPAGAGTRVLVDQGHGQRFLIGKSGPLHLSGLAKLFREEGCEIHSNPGAINDEALATEDVLVLSGPFIPYTPAEVDAITRFIDRGGSLAIMLHIGPPLADLLHRLGVDFSNSVVHERHNIIKGDPLNFRVTALEPHPLTQGLKGFSLYGGWALMNTGDNASIVAVTTSDAWVDLDGSRTLSPGDAVQAFGVIGAGTFGSGRFVIFGDDAIFQNRFLDADNTALARNMIKWLKLLPV